MNKIKSLFIAENNFQKTIFDTEEGFEYIIPLYQRAFAWKEKEIMQLIEDIYDMDDVGSYYLGSLIVNNRKEEKKYEVIDGQQRLTALYLLLNYLDKTGKISHSLHFECRDKSEYSLAHIENIVSSIRSGNGKYQKDSIEEDLLEKNIVKGVEIIKSVLDEERFADAEEKIKNNLGRVILYRIEVPEHTDLNRYFEIMNVRGEQLEQADILKAKLMESIKSEAYRENFACIWDACSDMNCYVQMRFGKNLREKLFKSYWNKMPEVSDLTEIARLFDNTGRTEKDISVKSVISEDYKTEWGEETEDEGRVRFESIINFPYFLLHTLRVFAHINDFAVGDFTSGLLDDKKLTETFDNFVKEYGAEKFSSEFIAFLLKSRYLFDKYIIKREFKNDNDDGDWSLKELFSYGQGGQKKPQYNNTRFVIGKGKDGKNEHQENLMIQSCMRVSYTSPKIMHWITELLKYLFKEQSDLSGSNVFIERIAETAVWENYLYKGNESLGVATPHIVFNFLDYLLWKENKNKYQDFIFEFRNSVEHWYPQHPSEGSFPEWSEEAELNHFGNLCIVSRDINSKFSNLAPEAKKSTYKESVLKGSIKLRIMSALTDNSEKWKNETFSEHGLEMLNLLKKYCRPETV